MVTGHCYRTKQPRGSLRVWLAVGLFGLQLTVVNAANSLKPPDDPRQSITFWRQHSISADVDPMARMARDVFQVLLRTWDNSRLEPGLYVVKSSAGPWAASLEDGNILLSRAAVETCLKFGKDRAPHLLAFVLAHELAHQRSDDLWHQRFFRMVGNQGVSARKQLLKELAKDKSLWKDVGQKERQADHDALIMMSSVGYDPYQVLDKKDFFTQWVENIWQESCEIDKKISNISTACKQAKSRALRAHAQLTAVADQSVLYEMGIQSLIAGNYIEARRFLKAYGRSYTNRAVLSSLGLSYFAEALSLQRKITHVLKLDRPDFYYPLLLDITSSVLPDKNILSAKNKRASSLAQAEKDKKRLKNYLEQSIEYYEKAIRLEPEYAKTYLMLAFSYLLDKNTFMARGIIQGKYIPRFGLDRNSRLILAMTNSLEGNSAKAEKMFAELIKSFKQETDASPTNNFLLYTSYHNSAMYAEYLNKKTQANELWQELAKRSQAGGNAMLFRLAVNRITNKNLAHASNDQTIKISGYQLGDRFKDSKNRAAVQVTKDIWIEGEKYKVYRITNGSRFIVGTDGRVANAWQDGGRDSLSVGLKTGQSSDRVFKILGVPSRQLHLVSGEYLAYDTHGIAVRVSQNKVAGWFLYSIK